MFHIYGFEVSLVKHFIQYTPALEGAGIVVLNNFYTTNRKTKVLNSFILRVINIYNILL